MSCCSSLHVNGSVAGASVQHIGVYTIVQGATIPAYLGESQECSIEWADGWMLWCFDEGRLRTRAVWWSASQWSFAQCPSGAAGWAPLRVSCLGASDVPLEAQKASPPLPSPGVALRPPPSAPPTPGVRLAATICVAILGEWHPNDLRRGIGAQLGVRLTEPLAAAGQV